MIPSLFSNSHLFVLSLLGVVGVELLQMGEGCARVQALGAGQRAQTNLVAFTKLHVTTEHLEALLSELIS